METTQTISYFSQLPSEIQRTFGKSNEFLARKYDGVAPSPEELAIFYLSGVEAHEIVANLERQVLQVSGKELPEKSDHLLQTYLDMQNDNELKA